MSLTPYKTYLLLRFLQQFFFFTIVTVFVVYQATVVKLNPLQLALVGTALEVTTFLFEVPTGVVADVISRKLSVVIGLFLTGIGFMVSVIVPSFTMVLISQVIWGIGFTFISGAREAWITDEIGQENAGKAYMKGAQMAQIGSLFGIVISTVLAQISIIIPILVGGFLHAMLAPIFYFLMTEEKFTPIPKKNMSTWNHLFGTFKQGASLIRTHTLLPTIILIGGFYGAFSEGIDRLWTPHFLKDFVLPPIGNLQPVVWFGIFLFVGMVLTVIATGFARKEINTNSHSGLTKILFIFSGVIMISSVAFGLAGNFALAALCFWLTYFMRRTYEPLYDTWVNQSLIPEIRATVFSMASQANALGEIVGGPLFGSIALYMSLRTGLVSAALILLPALLLYIVLMRNSKIKPVVDL